ncbi:MAG TPA: c-type cytochrome [Cyclobacteriaceae bacterium]|nr:c-type cytochrome [Cyclobacteriaceae bacterium]
MIKRILKGLLLTIVVLVLCFSLYVIYRLNKKFDAPYPDIRASNDSSLIARGKYLAYGPAHCSYCHVPMKSFINVEKGEIIPLSGGFDFQLPFGVIHAPNITPDIETGIGKFTDGEIARALRYGVKHDGKALLDFMPFYHISDRDLTAIISFLRSQEPVKNKRPSNELNILGKIIIATVIKPMGDGVVSPMPEPDSTVVYGKYLAEYVANCRGCHTERSMMTGAYIGKDYAGNNKIEMIDETGKIIKGQHLVVPNISPDPQTGRIYPWTKDQFIARFRTGKAIPGSPMPWGPFSRMTDLELAAIYKYLKTVEPVFMVTPVGIQTGGS